MTDKNIQYNKQVNGLELHRSCFNNKTGKWIQNSHLQRDKLNHEK